MADYGTRRVERPEFQDSDPFAELTRIMGHDPRRDQQPSWDDASLDLESELLGDLDLSEGESWGQPSNDDRFRSGEGVEEIAHVSQPAVEIAPEAWSPEPQSDIGPVEAEDDFSFQLDNSFAEQIEAALRRGVADAEPEPVASAPQGEAETLEHGEDEVLEDVAPDAWPEDLSAEAVWIEPVATGVAEEEEPSLRVASVHEFRPAEDGPAPAPEEWAAEDEWAAGAPPAYDEYVEPEAGAESAHDFSEMDSPKLETGWAEADYDEPVGDDVGHPVHLSHPTEQNIEDELAAMLAADPVPGAAPEAAASASTLSWQPAVAAAPSTEDPAAAAPAAQAIGGQAYADEPAPSYSDEAPPHADEAPSYADEIDMPARSVEEAFGVPDIDTVEVAEHVPAPSQDLHLPELPSFDPPPAEFDDLAAELDQAFELLDTDRAQREADDRSTPAGYASQAGLAAAAGAGAAAYAYAGRATYAAPAAAPAAHDLDVQGEEDWSLGDDFDQQYPYDETEGFDFETVPAAAPAPRKSGSRRGLFVALGVVAVAIAGGAGVYALSSGGSTSGEPVLVRADAEPVRVRPENPGGAVVPNQDNEVYRRLSGIQQEQAAAQERLVTTAEEPVNVAAQTAPPVVADPEPEAEIFAEPEMGLDLPVAEPPATVQPVLDSERIATVKADERVGRAQDEVIASAGDDMIALEPRRVRTMVVRPDGTMVPREEIEAERAPAAPQAEQQVASLPSALEPAADLLATIDQPEAAAPAAGTELAASGPAEEQPGASASATEDAAAPTVALPATVPPPVDRPQTVRQPAAQQPAAAPQQQVASVAPAAPATGAAAAAGTWSMQIASQPSAESAQATYQDLARRYSSLLEGRGVNIVRAEIEGRGTYYRVRIPTATRDDAITLCTRYKAAGGSCFVSQ